MLSQAPSFVAPLRLVPAVTTPADDSAFEMAAAATNDLLAQLKREWALEDNKRRLDSLFRVSGPAITVDSSTTQQPSGEPLYMGYPVAEYEDETPCYDYEQFGGAY